MRFICELEAILNYDKDIFNFMINVIIFMILFYFTIFFIIDMSVTLYGFSKLKLK